MRAAGLSGCSVFFCAWTVVVLPGADFARLKIGVNACTHQIFDAVLAIKCRDYFGHSLA